MKHSVAGLFKSMLGEIRTLLRQELSLVKTEMSEKATRIGRNVTSLALGGFAAYAGLIVLLMSLGLLLAWAFTIAGLPQLLAGFIGLAIVGLLVAGGGAMLLFKGLHTLSKESLVPEKSVDVLQHLKEMRSDSPAGQARLPKSNLVKEPRLSSSALKSAAFATEKMLDQTLDEIQERLSPRQIAHRMKERVVRHPVRFGVILTSLTAGLVATVLVRRKYRHA